MFIRRSIGCVALWLICAAASVMPSQASPSHAGLVRTTDTRLRVVYTRPGADLSRFRTIQLQPLAIPPDVADATPRNTRPRGRESFVLGERQIARMQDDFSQAVRSSLTRAGYTFVDTPGADTLVVTPIVTDITLAAPLEGSRPGRRSRTYSQGSGSIAISAVLADGGTGQVIAMTTARNRPSNMWRVNNRVTNAGDARDAFNEWARSLRSTLQGP